MILCIGEILADLIGEYNGDNIKYERFVGGAPLNVACGIKNLEGAVGFIGSVGNDIIGNFLYEYCLTKGFEYLDVRLDPEHNTTLAFVENDPNGERSFCFFRQNTADYQIDYSRLNVISKANIVHVGSLMLREQIGRELAHKIMDIAKENGKLISFDINFRDDIYNSTEEAKDIYLEYIQRADILKFSEDEVELFTGSSDLSSLNDVVQPDQLVFVTLGSQGSYYQYKDLKNIVESIKVKPVDTTGAGDAFYACVLRYLDELQLSSLNDEIIVEILKKANRCGALACGKKGALSALPTLEELNNL
jgi:fructokinase